MQDGQQPRGLAFEQIVVVVLEFQAASSPHILAHDIWRILHLGVAWNEASVDTEHTVFATADESAHSLACLRLCGAVCKRVPQVPGRVHEPALEPQAATSHSSLAILLMATEAGAHVAMAGGSVVCGL